MASAAGGTSQRLYPGRATVRARSRSANPEVDGPAAVSDIACSLRYEGWRCALKARHSTAKRVQPVECQRDSRRRRTRCATLVHDNATNAEGKTVTVPDPARDFAVGTVSVQVCRVGDAGLTVHPDELAAEEPLEIRLGCGDDSAREDRAVSVTMRTPGHDQELAVGFLFAEGIIRAHEQLLAVHTCKSGNVVRVRLRSGVQVNLAQLERHFLATSS